MQASCGEDSVRMFYWDQEGKTFRTLSVSSFAEHKDRAYRYMWNDTQMAGGKQNLSPMWKKLMKNVDLDEPTSFLDHVNLGTQREFKTNESIAEQDR